jgi:hypothetical protein
MTISELASKLEAELEAQKEELAKRKIGLDLRQSRIKKKEVDQNERDIQVQQYEKLLDQKYEELSRKQNAARLDAELREKQHGNNPQQPSHKPSL